MSADIDEATANTVSLAKRRADEEREQREMEKAAHEEAVLAETMARMTELEKVMEVLTKPEQRLVRLHAAVVCAMSGHTPSRRQEQLDDMALRLARYMASGVA